MDPGFRRDCESEDRFEVTLDEFLRWEDGTDTRYELIRGVPVPRPLQPNAHGMLVARSGTALPASVGIEISMSDPYEGFVFPEDEDVPIP
jgi:hypothetical protein